MRPDRFRQFFATLALTSSALLVCCVPLHAQDTPSPAPANSSQKEPPADVRDLSNAVRELQAQVQALKTQLNEMRAQQQQALEDSRELRRQLAANSPQRPAPTQAASSYNSLPSASATETNPALPANPPAAITSTQEETTSDRLSKMEEDVQFIDAKLNDQYQTKVESGSKYRVRLSGIVLLNLFSDRGSVDNVDFPGLAVPSTPLQSNSAIGGSLRQSQLNVSAFGPDIAGAHTSANLTFDFAGGFPDTQNGQTMGLVRLRTGTINFDWGNTSVIVGQDGLFISPLTPTSVATLAVPPLSYSGNLWGWTPQVRIEHQVHLSESSALHFQFGILDSLTGDTPEFSPDRYPSWGEQSGQPAYASRIAWSYHLFGRDLIAGLGGYYARQSWAFGRTVDGWAGTSDLTIPLGKYFDFSGEFYRGRAVGGLGGGIDQTILLSGSFVDPTTVVQGLNSMGGWAQLKFKPKPKFEVNGAFGQDNPYASQINLFPASANVSEYGPFAERNRSAFANIIYQPRSDVLLGLEYRRLRTFYFGGDSDAANHVNISVGYIF
jgi:Spy/CpxP family protein refolding chaperone